MVSKFSFVDLAGSERIKKSKVSGLERREAICINSSLLSLCNCINLLSKKNTYKNIHIPYRQSKLTRILQYALEGDCFTAMIVCINGNNFESYDALNYATRAMNIQLENVKQENNKIDLNTIIKENKELKNIIEQLKIENTQLKEENNILKKKLTDYFEIKKENKINNSEEVEKAQNKNISSTEINKKKINKFNQLKNTSIDEKINKLTINDLLNTPTKINNLTNKNLFMFPIDKSNNENLKRLKNVNLKKVTFSENNEYKFITPIRNRVSFLDKISDLMKKNEEGNSKKSD
ncbi:hypothetical protein H311_01124 [Anncaliia algerae PRA109]|nr:hypothetical protein H311_01124 [Anncaliia algerae PRA109]